MQVDMTNQRLRKPYTYGKSITKENLFSCYTVDESGCWNWKYGQKTNGRGQVRYDCRVQLVARVVFELFRSPIPSGMCVCHSCDNILCINPDHLWLGSYAANSRDSFGKRRQRRAIRIGLGNPCQRRIDRLMKLLFLIL